MAQYFIQIDTSLCRKFAYVWTETMVLPVVDAGQLVGVLARFKGVFSTALDHRSLKSWDEQIL